MFPEERKGKLNLGTVMIVLNNLANYRELPVFFTNNFYILPRLSL